LQQEIVHESQVTPPHPITETQDLDGRQQDLDTHLGGSPELLVRNEFVDVHPLSTSMFQSQYYVYNIIYNVSGVNNE
jgi:hypothetical protein